MKRVIYAQQRVGFAHALMLRTCCVRVAHLRSVRNRDMSALHV
ncbi:hypothetical protein LCGC14_1048090 [marine sediment metagenome]|uniref:Uncharacterized protein n=1 Tax=marine sediment metagenome TaxID=412755 RepID=A0A0F9QVV3_9ZZZZ